MKAAIVFEPWKLPIFERHLCANGYAFERGLLTPEQMVLVVTTDNLAAMRSVVQAAVNECALSNGGVPQ